MDRLDESGTQEDERGLDLQVAEVRNDGAGSSGDSFSAEAPDATSPGDDTHEDAPVDPEPPRTFTDRLIDLRGRLRARLSSRGLWLAVVVGGLAVTIYYLVGLIASIGDTPPPQPEPIDPRMVAIGVLLVLSGIFVLLSIRAGLITLSSQTIACRRNVLAAASLLLLDQVLPAGLAQFIGADAAAARSSQALMRGAVVCFLLYSFVEYGFNFLFDWARAGREWETYKHPLSWVSLALVGVYRVAFDVILPLLAACYVAIFHNQDAVPFLTEARSAISCRALASPELEEYSAKLNAALARLNTECPDCGEVGSELDSISRTLREKVGAMVLASPAACNQFLERQRTRLSEPK